MKQLLREVAPYINLRGWDGEGDAVNIAYDKRADVLYITLRFSRQNCRYVETGSGAILRVDRCTSEIVGCTIPMFSRRLAHGELDIPEIGDAIVMELLSRSAAP